MENKNIGRKSSAQDNFIGPNPVTNLTATDVPSGRAFNDGRIDLSWTNPSTGNTPTGYKILRGGSQIATVSHPTNTYSNTGLSSNTSYSYTVVAYDSYADSSAAGPVSATATTVPNTPSAPSATAGVNQDTLSWSAPANGGSAILDYFWESTDSKSNTVAGTSTTVTQEANTSQQYKVRARNANGSSAFSALSGSVTTLAPSFFAPPFFPPAFFSPPFFPPAFFSPPFFPPVFFSPPFFPPVFFTPPFFPPVFFSPPFFPPVFFSPPFFPPAFFFPPFFPPAFFSPPFFPPIFFAPPGFSGGGGQRFY